LCSKDKKSMVYIVISYVVYGGFENISH